MAGINLIHKIYIDNLIQQSKQNQLILKELLYSSYPYEEIRTLINNLIYAMDKLIEQLLLIKENALNENNINDVDSDIKLYAELLGKVHKLYEFIEVSRVENIPQSLVYLIEHLTKNIESESAFVLVPTYQNNYLYIELSQHLHSMFELAIENVNDLFPLEDKKFSILMFPFAYKNTFFSYFLLAHEIGHFIENRYDIVADLSQNINLDFQRIDAIARNIILTSFSQFDQPLELFDRNWDSVLARTNSLLRKIIDNWMKELVCDLLAINMLGPSYIISFVEFILTHANPSIGSTRHPPPLLRLNLLMSEYETSGFYKEFEGSTLDYIKKFHECILEIKGEFSEIEINKDSIGELYYYAYETVEAQLDNIKEKILEITESLNIKCNVKKIVEEIEPLRNSIVELVVPCELKLGVPADPVSVLNAAVVVYLVETENIFSKYQKVLNKSKIEIVNSLNELSIKGLELCLIQNKVKSIQT